MPEPMPVSKQARTRRRDVQSNLWQAFSCSPRNPGRKCGRNRGRHKDDPSEARINARACKPTSCGRVHRRGGPEEEEKALGACSWRFGRTKLSISCSQACTRSRMQFQGPVLGSLYVSVWVGACIRQHTSCAALVHMRANV